MKIILRTLTAMTSSLLFLAATAGAAEYSFTVSNITTNVYCGQLEIKVVHNGQQTAGAFTRNAMSPGIKPEVINLSTDYCTQIQFKTVCSGNVNQHSKGCSGGIVQIVSKTEMNY